MRIIFIHGFGGRSYDHPDASALREVGRELYAGLPVETHAWQSGRISTRWTGAEWLDANREAVRQADLLAEKIRAGQLGERVYLVAFSLGCLVALETVRRGGPEVSSRIAGVCLMGAAVPADYDFRSFPSVPRGVLNYYSPKLDKILSMPFQNANGAPAAGQIGFHQAYQNSAVMNLRVHKAHKLFGGYKQVARVIAQLIGYWEGLPGPSELVREVKEDDWSGQTFWDEVYRRGSFLIQRWRVLGSSGDFRLVEQVGERTRRLASASTLHPLLAELDRMAAGATAGPSGPDARSQTSPR